MSYLLPFHKTLRCEDRFSIMPDADPDIDTVAQADLLKHLILHAQHSLEVNGVPATTILLELIQDIACNIHNDTSSSFGPLSKFLDANHESFDFQTALWSLLRSALRLEDVFPEQKLHYLSEIDAVDLSSEQANALLAHLFLGTCSRPPGNEWGRPGFQLWYTTPTANEDIISQYLKTLLHHFTSGGYHPDTSNFHFHLSRSPSLEPDKCSRIPDFIASVLATEIMSCNGSYQLVACHPQPGPGPHGTHEELWMGSVPVLVISSLLCPVLPEDCAVVTSTLPIHATWIGHGRTAKLAEAYELPSYPARPFILADALELDVMEEPHGGSLRDLGNENVEREVRKLYAGFHGAALAEKGPGRAVVEAPPWGCGAFGGNILAKAICIMIAGALADVKVELKVLERHGVDVDAIRAVVEKGHTAAELWRRVRSERARGCGSSEELRDVMLE